MNESGSERPPGFAGFAAAEVPETPVIAPGESAAHSWGVQYQGSFEGEADGTARAVRLHARALAATGIPVLLQSFTGRFRGPDGSIQSAEAMSERVKAEVQDLRHASVGTLKIRIKHAVIQHADFLRSYILPRSVMQERDPELVLRFSQALYESTIVYSVWERTTIDPAIAGILRRVGECWVPSTHNRDLLRKHGVERVVVVPHPYEPTSPYLALAGRDPRGTPPRWVEPPPEDDPTAPPVTKPHPWEARRPHALLRRRFYAIGIWQPRKAYHELVGAFLRAFHPGDSVHLTVKYREFRWPGYPSPEESVASWLGDARVRDNAWGPDNLKPHLSLVGDHWPEARITHLHARSNIYVAASHGEAFCLPAMDAKLCGNRLLHVPWGGTADLAESDDLALPYTLEPIPPSYGWEPGAEWATVDVEALTEALRRAEPPGEFRTGEKVRAMSFEAVGRLMRERVDARVREIG